MDIIELTAETKDIVHDADGLPVEWTLLHAGDNPYCQEGIDGNIALTSEGMQEIVDYYEKKGEKIPIDSEHYLYYLAREKKMNEADVLHMFPGGVSALGFGTLALEGEKLRLKAQWTPAARQFLKEKIYRYFSPVIRGLDNGPLRVTSVTMTNTPAFNNQDAIAASANRQIAAGKRKDTSMGKLNKALGRLLGRDVIALEAEVPDEKKEKEEEKIALEVEEKASLIEQVKALLGLDKDAALEEVIAALKAEVEKGKTAAESRKQLEEMAASAEKRAHSDLVAQGRNEGKITEADMEYVNSLDSKALSAHLAHTAPKVPVGRVPVTQRRNADAMALSSVDRLAIDSLRNAGIKDAEKEYLKRKEER